MKIQGRSGVDYQELFGDFPYPTLTPEEEQAAIKRAKAGDEDAYRLLFRAYGRLLNAWVQERNRAAGRAATPPNVDGGTDDAFLEAAEAFIKAIQSFDTEKHGHLAKPGK